jgi:hypothetical protein
VSNDISKTEKFADNVVIFRNRLNEVFERNYGRLIKKYKETCFTFGSTDVDTENNSPIFT